MASVGLVTYKLRVTAPTERTIEATGLGVIRSSVRFPCDVLPLMAAQEKRTWRTALPPNPASARSDGGIRHRHRPCRLGLEGRNHLESNRSPALTRWTSPAGYRGPRTCRGALVNGAKCEEETPSNVGDFPETTAAQRVTRPAGPGRPPFPAAVLEVDHLPGVFFLFGFFQRRRRLDGSPASWAAISPTDVSAVKVSSS